MKSGSTVKHNFELAYPALLKKPVSSIYCTRHFKLQNVSSSSQLTQVVPVRYSKNLNFNERIFFLPKKISESCKAMLPWRLFPINRPSVWVDYENDKPSDEETDFWKPTVVFYVSIRMLLIFICKLVTRFYSMLTALWFLKKVIF